MDSIEFGTSVDSGDDLRRLQHRCVGKPKMFVAKVEQGWRYASRALAAIDRRRAESAGHLQCCVRSRSRMQIDTPLV
jgi:hypothetical protein